MIPVPGGLGSLPQIGRAALGRQHDLEPATLGIDKPRLQRLADVAAFATDHPEPEKGWNGVAARMVPLNCLPGYRLMPLRTHSRQ